VNQSQIEKNTCIYIGEELARYGFGNNHPFGPQRMYSFWEEAQRQGLDKLATLRSPVLAPQQIIETFHTHEYVELVKSSSLTGEGFLDAGDTPAFKGVYEAASYVVGSVIDAVNVIMAAEFKRAFIPIAGLHHARRETAAGFCVFNDCGIAIEVLRKQHGIKRIAYVDIDAHHGDGVFYSFEHDPDLIFIDIHEDGQYLYPGTGKSTETGLGAATGTKLNIPVSPDADDETFLRVWPRVEAFLQKHKVDFILLQCGADSLAGDPITHLKFSQKSHAHAATSLRNIANEMCQGRLLAMGGGGYNHENIAKAWTSVVKALIDDV